MYRWEGGGSFQAVPYKCVGLSLVASRGLLPMPRQPAHEQCNLQCNSGAGESDRNCLHSEVAV